jgi:anti-sigma factor RsiW
MMDLKQHCKGMDEKLADLLLDPASVPAEVREHVAECEGCGRELAELRATMGMMDAWKAPEPSPYFFTRLNARMREERQAAPQGWLARLKAQFAYGPRRHMRPLAATALAVVMLAGGGTYLSVSHVMQPQPQPQTSDAAVVHDLQTLENNAQVLDTLEDLASNSDDSSSN